MTEKRLEVDLYKPIQTLFIKDGYKVYGEVNDCDMTAVKDDELIIIELKLSLTVDLLVQATKRQRLTDRVYIAIPKPKYKMRSKKWNDLCHLLRRLELGLIVVSFTKKKQADILIEPSPYERRKNYRKRKSLLNEIDGRSADYNVGGSSRQKIMTAYKENCIQIATYLQQCGPLSPKKLTELGTGKKTSSILSKNYYHWFDRIKRGTYVLSEKGKQELSSFPELTAYYSDQLKKVVDNDKL